MGEYHSQGHFVEAEVGQQLQRRLQALVATLREGVIVADDDGNDLRLDDAWLAAAGPKALHLTLMCLEACLAHEPSAAHARRVG